MSKQGKPYNTDTYDRLVAHLFCTDDDYLFEFSGHRVILYAHRITGKLKMMVFIKIMGDQPT
jgi:hypothetical protein